MQRVLWFLLSPAALAFSHLGPLSPPTVAAASSDMMLSPMPAPRPECPSMCGDVHIPYPFGIGINCSWPGTEENGFTVTCNNSFSPPRPYQGSFEIISITLEACELRVFSPGASQICYNSSNHFESISWRFDFAVPPFLISQMRNTFTAIGCNTLAFLDGGEGGSYFTGCITSCKSLHEAAQDGEECTGLGCCQMPIPTNLSTIQVSWGHNETYTRFNPAWRYSPCSYAFVAEKGWYVTNRDPHASASID